MLKSFVPILEPVRRPLGPTGETGQCYTFKIVDWLGLLLKHDSIVREHILTSSELWKTGIKKKKASVIRDFTDAQNFRESRMADAAITDKEKSQLRVSLILSYDDLELVRFALRPCVSHFTLTVSHLLSRPSRRPPRRPLSPRTPRPSPCLRTWCGPRGCRCTQLLDHPGASTTRRISAWRSAISRPS